ncbi:MAG: 3-deoxy-D-manno-octulosonic acid transferase, partial [Nitrospirae bacterium]|nr:3-deoxy-D-manno-octulosonic acid transferase [Nitrospirota bacterium]
MWYLAYNVLLILASPVILLTLLVKKRCRRGLAQRLGWLPEGFLQNGRRGGQAVLWVHAVSLGEVVAAVPLVQELHRRYPTHRIVVSTVTETGREAVEQRLDGVAEHCYAPLDFPWVVARVVARMNPRGFLFVETELWPNLLRALARRGVPAILVNGRLSSRSFRRYRLVRPFMTQVLETLTSCLMQSERDAERIVALGASPALVHRTGNIKFDQPRPDETGGGESMSRGLLGLVEDEELIVAGSTHPGEEEQILSCYEILRQEFPCLVLLLAPRHIERAAEVEATVRQRRLTV